MSKILIGQVVTILPIKRAAFGAVLLIAAVLSPVAAAMAPTGDALAAGPALDQEKLMRAARILKAADKRAWSVAFRELDGVPELYDYVLWRRLLDDDNDLGFEAYADFLKRYPDWPRLDIVRRRAEASLDLDVTVERRLEYFQQYPPVSRDGRLRLIEALLQNRQESQARELAIATWIESGFSSSEQRGFLDAHARYLRPEHHSARLHRLLWDGRSTEAQRMFDLVGDGDRAIAVARIRLQQMSKGVDGAIARVPDELERDPGLLYDRLLWRRRKGRDADARDILLDPPDELGRPELWWHERKRQVNKLVDERRFGEALELVGPHGQTSGLSFAEAEWLTGWLALRFDDDPARSLVNFERLHAGVNSPISLGRAAYWAGRASDVLGAPADAQRWYRLAANHPTSFYGQEAAAELGVVPELFQSAFATLRGLVADDSRTAVVRLLCLLDARDEVLPFLRQMLTANASAAEAVRLAADCGRPEVFVDVTKNGVRHGLIDPALSYPVPQLPSLFAPAANRVDAALVLAIARQESQFAIDAKSPAGALGLMQLMPATAREMSGRLGMRFTPHLLRYDPDYNLRIAGAYLDKLLQRYRDVEYLSVAAYNAGPGAVERWVRQHGDPRTMSDHDRIDWLELIPYAETRNYVQRVVEGQRNYRALLRSGTGVSIPSSPRRGPFVPLPMQRPVSGGTS